MPTAFGGALSVATQSHAKAAGVSTEGAKVDSTLYKGGKAYELDAVSVTGSRAPMTVEQSPKIVTSMWIGNVDAIQENGNLVKGSTIDGDIRLNTKATTLTDIHAGS